MATSTTSRCNSGNCFFSVGVTEVLDFNIKIKTLIICFFSLHPEMLLAELAVCFPFTRGPWVLRGILGKLAWNSWPFPHAHLVLVMSPDKTLDNFFMHWRVFLLFCCHSLYLTPYIFLASLETDFFNEGKTLLLEDLCFISPSIAHGCVVVFPAPPPPCFSVDSSDNSWFRYLQSESKLNFRKCLLAFIDDSLIDLGFSFHHCPFKSVVLCLSFYSWIVFLVFANC